MQKTYAIFHKLIKSDLVSGSFFLFAGTTVGNVLAFLFNVFLVKHVTYAQYAEFSALISLITLSSIPAQAFLPTIVHFSGRFFAKNDTEKASQLFKQASQKIGIIAIIVLLVFTVFSGLIGKFLHISNNLEILLVGAVIASVYVSVTNNAFLQSLLRFPFLSMTIICAGVIKVFGGIGFFLLGFGLTGVFWGYFLSFVLPFLITLIPLRFLLKPSAKKIKPMAMGEIVRYGLPAAVAVFSLSSFTSTDILLVKHFFPSSETALYSGLSLVGRIIFYFTAPISVVMFPLIVKRFHKGEKFHSLLYASFLLVLIPSVGITLFYFLFPHVAIHIFLGKRYLAVSPYLGWFGIYLCIFSLMNVLVNFFLSLKKTYVSWVIALGALLQAVGIWLFHTSIAQIIGISLTLSSLLFIVLLLYYMNEYAPQIQKK